MAVQPPPGFTLVAPSGPTNPAVPPNAQPIAPQATPTAPPLPPGFQATKAPDFDPDSLLGRIGSRIGERVEKVERASEEYSAGEITYPELAMRGVAFAYGSLFDTVGEGVMSLLSALTPDEAENFLKEQLAAGGTALMNTEQAQRLIEMWDGFDQLTKDRIANLADTAAGAGQFAKSPTSVLGEKLSASAIKSDKKGLAPKVLDQTSDAKQARGKEIGRDPSKQFQTNFDEDILNTVISLTGVTGNIKLPKLLEKLNTAERHLNGQIQKALVKSSVPVPKQTINQAIELKLKQLELEKPEFADDKQLAAIVKRVKALNNSALKNYNGKPIQLLEARRNLDRIISQTFGDNLYEGLSTSRTVVKQFRDVYNELMQNSVEDVNIQSLMQRQHHLLEAIDNASYANTKGTPKNLLQKVGSAAERHPFLAAGALGLSEQGSRMLDIPPGVMALGAAGLGAYGMATPNVRRVAGGVMENAPVSTGLLYGTTNMDLPEPQQ